ncbi:unnamed protein product, partial [Phytomonas sp. Hart1]
MWDGGAWGRWGVALTLFSILFAGWASARWIWRPRRSAEMVLNMSDFLPVRLLSRRQVSPDGFLFRFALEEPGMRLELPVGNHVVLRGPCGEKKEEGKRDMVQHSYTPISEKNAKGYVDFLIKVYFAGVNPKFPLGGRLTQYLHSLCINDVIDMRGPIGRFEYLGNGRCKIGRRMAERTTVRVETLAMIGGGSGLTPLLQIIYAVRKDPSDTTKIILIYANQTPEDILLRDELDSIAQNSQGMVKVWYTVDRNAPTDWPYDVGFINEEMLRAHLSIPQKLNDENLQTEKNENGMKATGTNGENSNKNGKDNNKWEEKTRSVLALVCGPHAMNQNAVVPNLEKMGYSKDDIFVLLITLYIYIYISFLPYR